MRVSIAMATYNGAPYIGEQLASFARQSRLPDELVVCDDGSTDATVAIVEAFAATAPFYVRVGRNPENLGYTANFSRAARQCTGDFIFLSDQDDVWYEKKIAAILDEFVGEVAVVLNDQDLRHSDGTVSGTVLGNMRALGFGKSMFVTGSCTAMTRPFADLALPFPSAVPYDHWISYLADALGVRRVVDRPLQLFRRHDSNTSDSIFAQRDPTRLGMHLRYARKDPRPAWRSEIAALALYRQRLDEQRVLAATLSSSASLDAAIAAIDDESQALVDRLAALERLRLSRVMAVARLWRAGGYDRFSGWKSAVRDLVRP